ncbi:COMM domain-containing protein 9 [Polymixia lowei]
MAAAISNQHFASLQLLLKAPSKDAVRDLCVESHRSGAPEARRLLEKTAETLCVPAAEAQQLLLALHTLSHYILFHNLTSPEQILSVFPDSFHSSLKNLLAKILLEHSTTWRTEALRDHMSLAQLKALDWRVDMVTGSDCVGGVAVPSCLLQLQMEDSPPGGGVTGSSVTVELSRETLDTMLDGLERIRQQLSVVAGK